MKLLKLFAATKSKWPKRIDIRTARLLPDGGFLSWELVRCEERAQASEKSGIGLLEAAIWPFHQAICSVAEKLTSLGKVTVSPNDVNIGDFEKFLLRTLADESWAAEQEEYLKYNPRHDISPQ